MSISIKDFSTGLIWDQNNFYFVPFENDPKNSKILVEYLNDIPSKSIEKDVKLLSDFNALINTKNKKDVEDYIMSKLSGFTEYEDGYYAFITGANDLSPSVLYDLESNKIFLIHPNFKIREKYFITIDNLVKALNLKKCFNKCLFN